MIIEQRPVYNTVLLETATEYNHFVRRLVSKYKDQYKDIRVTTHLSETQGEILVTVKGEKR